MTAPQEDRASTLRRWSLSLLALLGIGVIIVGLPVVLLSSGAPFAGGGGPPSLHQFTRALTSPDDGTLAVDLIKVVGWLSWAVLTSSLLLEILARARGMQAPQLPGLRLPQAAARSLVGTVLLAGAALPAGAGIAHAATLAATAPISATHIPAAGTHEDTSALLNSSSGTTATSPSRGSRDEQSQTVNHTVVHGETLWSIAGDRLGDGRRYPEIVALNEHRLHGEGSFLREGWVLRVPASPVSSPAAPQDAGPAAKTVVVRAGDTLSGIAQQHLGDADRYPEIVDASRDITQPGGRHLTDANDIHPGWTVRLPGHRAAPASSSADQQADHPDRNAEHTPQPAAPQPAGPRPVASSAASTPPSTAPTPSSGATSSRPPDASAATGVAPVPSASITAPTSVPAASPVTAPAQDHARHPEQDEHLQERPAWTTRTGFGAGALLAAGLITLVAGRRRTQQRRRRPGQRLPVPPAPAARMEQELRATADALSVEAVDSVLRALARTCTDTDVSLPVVRAARLTATQFDLYLALPAQLPAPWAGTDDSTVWSLAVGDTGPGDLLAGDGGDEDDVAAPYPTLVTIGHDDEDGHVFLNLEYLGALGVIGDGEATREILAALAIELATSSWADDLQVTLVGAFPELEDTLQTGRIRYLPSVGRILQELQLRAEQDRRALAEDGAADLHTARVTGAAPDAWSPEIVLLAGDITTSQQAQLQDLLTQTPRVAIAAVTSGIRVGQWGLDLTAGDSPGLAALAPIGLQLRPQRVPAEQYGLLLELASLTDLEELTDNDQVGADGGASVGEPSLAAVAAVAPVAGPVQPASAMPEVTLQVLTAVADDASGSGERTPSGPSPAAVPVITGVFLPPAARAEAGLGQAEGPVEHAPGPQETPASGGGAPGGEEHGEHDQDLDHTSPAPRDPDQAEGPGDDESVDEAVDEAGTDESTTTQTTIATDDPTGGPDRGLGDEVSVPPAPRILVLGPVDIAHVGGKVEPSKRARLLELAAYLALNPGASHTAIDDAIWPDRTTEDNTNTRNPATSKLRRWVGTDPAGQEYLPRHQAGGGYAFLPAVTTDVRDWDAIVGHDPLHAATEDLETGLQLVRGTPFEGCHRRRYAWSELLRQRLISEIVDASYELARRRLMEGRWRAAESAVVVGLRIEPAQEHLWRLRILAAHESRNPAAEQEAIDRLLTITEQLECELEPETEQLLSALAAGADLQQIMAKAL